MKHELHSRLFARICICEIIVCFSVGWNAHIFTEEWTNWTLLSFACQIVIVVCGWRGIRGWEEPMTRWISFLIRRVER